MPFWLTELIFLALQDVIYVKIGNGGKFFWRGMRAGEV